MIQNEISYRIINRGDLILKINNHELIITGELTFTPPVFYADIKSLNRLRIIEKGILTDDEINEIRAFFDKNNLSTNTTKVFFD